MRNFYDSFSPSYGEQFDTLLEYKNIKIVRIVSSKNIESNIYCQDEDEWVVIIKGSAVVAIKEEEYTLNSGESLFIPAKSNHSVKQTMQGTIWLAVHIF